MGDCKQGFEPGVPMALFDAEGVVRLWPDPFLCRISALMGSVVAGAGVNPAGQRWGFWPLLPLSSLLQECF